MANSKRGILDPTEHGPWLFDGHPHRRAMALGCRDSPIGWTNLGEISGQKGSNGRRSAQAMCEWGVLEEVEIGDGESGLLLKDVWREPLEEAVLRAAQGSLASGNVLLLVLRSGVAPFYRLTADRDQPDPRVAWVARLPHHSRFGLMVLVNPALDEDRIERLMVELDDSGVEHERLVLGKMAGHTELREFTAGSLPGAFNPGR